MGFGILLIFTISAVIPSEFVFANELLKKKYDTKVTSTPLIRLPQYQIDTLSALTSDLSKSASLKNCRLIYSSKIIHNTINYLFKNGNNLPEDGIKVLFRNPNGEHEEIVLKSIYKNQKDFNIEYINSKNETLITQAFSDQFQPTFAVGDLVYIKHNNQLLQVQVVSKKEDEITVVHSGQRLVKSLKKGDVISLASQDYTPSNASELPGLSHLIESTDKIKLFDKKYLISQFDMEKFDRELINLDPANAEAMKRIRDKMMDFDSWSAYINQLIRDTYQEMKTSNNSNSVEAADRGEIWRSALLKVIVKRIKSRGTVRFSTLNKEMSRWDFNVAISYGPIFDKWGGNIKINGVTHGVDSHLIQRDYIASTVNEYWPGKEQRFYIFLAKKNTDHFWYYLFDQGPTTMNPTSPGFITEIFSQFIPIK